MGFFTYLAQYSHHANYLADIAIAKNHRRKGYAKELLQKFIEISRKQRTGNAIALSSTHVDNKASQKMHLSFDFKEIGRIKGLHYGKDEIFYGYDL